MILELLAIFRLYSWLLPCPLFLQFQATFHGLVLISNRARSQIEGGLGKNQYFVCPVVYTDNKYSNRRCQDQLANVEREREE